MYSFSYLEPVCCSMSRSNHVWLLPVLHTDFSRVRSGGLVFPSLPEFSRVCCGPHNQDFGIVNKAEVDVFLEISCFFQWCNRCWQFDLWFLCLLLIQLQPWNFIFHVLLKPDLENFEHYFTSMWDECNCVTVWVFFGIAFLWDWNENWPFPVVWPLLSFPNFLAYWVQHFHSIIFQDLNSSTEIPSPPLVLFIVILPKGHLTSHSRMPGSRWVITASWLSGREDSFCIVLLCILATSS